jgi:predicted AAA+ superfamily ATPase
MTIRKRFSARELSSVWNRLLKKLNLSLGDKMGLKEYVQRGIVKVWDDIYDSSLDDKAAPNLCDVYLQREISLYTDPEEFFRHTHLTKSMKELIEEITDSLEGKKGSRIFLLTSLFGGGKTHTLITIYHAFRSPDKLVAFDKELAARIAELGRTEIVAMDASSSKLVPHPAEPYKAEEFTISTIWGMLAYKLGAYAKIKHLDSKGSPAPEIERLRSVLSEVKVPTIILLDEIVPYVFNMSRSEELKDYGEKVILFLGNLAKAIEAFPNIVLVISIQAEYKKEGEIRYEELYRDVAEKILRHLHRESTRIIVPVSPEDMVMVLKKRIFADIPEKVTWRAKEKLYLIYRDHSDIFGMESDWQSSLAETGRTITVKDTYPFHPKYVEVLREFVMRNRNLQKTRDAIRITRKVVRRILNEREDSELVMPWHIDLRDKDIRNMVLTEGYREFRDVVNRDIVSEDGNPGSIANCSKPTLALKIATVVLLKTYTYETFKEPLKVFPDLKDVALMVYEPESFSSYQLQPPDIKATLEEMQAKLPHFAEEENRFWFTPYPSVLEYVEKKAEEKLRGPNLSLHKELVEYAEKALFESSKKGERPSGEIFTKRNVIIAGYGDDIRDKELIVKDIPLLRLLVLIKPDVKDEDLRNIILNKPEGGRRMFANTITVVYPSKSDLTDILRYVAKIKAAEEIRDSLSEYYKDKDIRNIQEKKLRSYINDNTNDLIQQMLSLMTNVAYPRKGKEGDDVKFVSTTPSSSLISQVEMILKDPQTGPKLRTDLSFNDLAMFLKSNLGWDLVEGDKQFEFRDILEVFYTNTAAPFITQKAVEYALLDGLDRLDIGIKIGKKLYWKKIGSMDAERPKSIEETAVILPYKMAAELMKDELLSKSGTQKIKGGMKKVWYEVLITEKESIPLEELVKQKGWEDILKAGVIQEKEEIIERGFILDVKPKHVEVKQGEKARFTIYIEPVEDYSEEIELKVEKGELNQSKGRPPMEVVWEILPEKTGSFFIKAIGSDGLHKESSVSVVILRPEEEKEVEEIDLSVSGEKLLSIRSSELSSLKIAIENVNKLGIKAKASITADFGGNIGFLANGVGIEVARFLVQKLDEISRFMLQIKSNISVEGNIEFEEPVVLDGSKISVLSQLNKKAKFRLLAKRK